MFPVVRAHVILSAVSASVVHQNDLVVTAVMADSFDQRVQSLLENLPLVPGQDDQRSPAATRTRGRSATVSDRRWGSTRF